MDVNAFDLLTEDAWGDGIEGQWGNVVRVCGGLGVQDACIS